MRTTAGPAFSTAWRLADPGGFRQPPQPIERAGAAAAGQQHQAERRQWAAAPRATGAQIGRTGESHQRGVEAEKQVFI
jgi:hypothetical protein